MKGLLFRCDFGGSAGWGHLVRCSALAQAARAYGFPTGLVTRGDLNELPEELATSFNAFFSVNECFPGDAFLQNVLAGDYSWDVVVVDHYDYRMGELGSLFSFLHSRNICCVQIEDHPKHFFTEADVIVCPGFSGEGLDLGIFGKDRVCAGLEYTLLRPAFGGGALGATDAMGALPTVALILGGTDPLSLMPRILDSLFEATGGYCSPSVITPTGIDYEQLQLQLVRFESHRIHMRLSGEGVARCFHASDYGITACGGTVYEMAALGLPFVGVCVAENQLKTAQSIEHTWSLPIIQAEDFSQDAFIDAWHQLTGQFPSGKTPYAAVDWRGPERVLSAIVRSTQAGRSRDPAGAGLPG